MECVPPKTCMHHRQLNINEEEDEDEEANISNICNPVTVIRVTEL